MTPDELDAKANEAFPGKVVRKDLVRRVKVGANVPANTRRSSIAILDALSDHWHGDDLCDGLPAIERVVRVLEDDLHIAAELSQLALLQRKHVPRIKTDRPRRAVQESQEESCHRRLPGTRFPYKPERFSSSDLEGDTIDGPAFTAFSPPVPGPGKSSGLCVPTK